MSLSTVVFVGASAAWLLAKLSLFVVAECAVAAATDDPRFPVLKAQDLGDLHIELSVLSEARRVAPQDVRPGIDGLIISCGEYRGILLPQVAVEHGWSRERFLQETCQKAGLSPNAWQNPDTMIEVFYREVFSEKSCAAISSESDSAAPDFYSSSTKSPS